MDQATKDKIYAAAKFAIAVLLVLVVVNHAANKSETVKQIVGK